MPSIGPTRLTDDFWLVAYDNVVGRPRISDWPLGVGLATGLMAELVGGGFLELRGGELFRTSELPDDRALRPVLAKMEQEEHEQWAAVRVPSPSWARHRHSRPGHNVRRWLSYLAYANRAESQVVERLSRAGLIRREERRRLWRPPSVRHVPFDSVAAATPSTAINTAVQRGLALTYRQLVLAGLFLATGLHCHAMATLTPSQRARLAAMLRDGLDGTSQELLRTADAVIGDAAMR